MEASAQGAREAGGHVIGVTMEFFSRNPNRFTDETVCTRDLWERLRVLTGRADGYVILPGATGTLAEIGLAWEMMCKRMMPPKPMVFLGDFWKPLHDLLITRPEAKAACNGLVRMAPCPADAINFIVSNLKKQRLVGPARPSLP